MASFILKIFPLVSAIFCLALALFVFNRNPKNPANVSFSMGMAALAVIGWGQFMALTSDPGAASLFWKRVALAGDIILPAPWLIFSLVFGRSNPSDYLRKWKVGIITVFLISLFFFFGLALVEFFPSDLPYKPDSSWLPAFLLIVFTVILANFEWTVRSANHTQRWRIKFLILGVGSVLAFMIYTLSQDLLYPAVEKDFSSITPVITIIGCALVTFSLLRHRLMDVDVYVSRDVAYNSFVIGVVAVYLVIVGLAAMTIRGLSGISGLQFALLFVYLAVLLLLVALLSTHVRRKMKFYINRHFYRGKYDYRRKWLEITDRLSSKQEPGELIGTVSDIFGETFWVDRGFFWLCCEGEDSFESLQPTGRAPDPPPAFSAEQKEALMELRGPLFLDRPDEGEDKSPLDENLKGMLLSSGISLLVPLILEKRFAGVLGLSDSRSGYGMDHEDLTLIKTIANQAAASLLSSKFSQDLLHAKEVEAFHAFSAFVVHDLKNFVSMLSLVVANMERKFEDPRFRADALTSISLTVEKMKRLMDRLAIVSREPELLYDDVDLNELARHSLLEMGGSLNSSIVEKYEELPPVKADPDQIRKVIMNLLLNAEEATGGKGEIRLETSFENGKASLSVADNGCGISREYLEKSLFRIFSTTKSNGFGIGLYQSRMIVEAHGGSIEVESEYGRGSNFTILLPAEEG